MAILGPYYYGKYNWDNYLVDIQTAFASMRAAYRESIEVQSEALAVAHEQVEELREKTEQLRHIEQTLESGFEELRAEFEWGFTLMVDQMDRQVERLSHIAASQDAIQKSVQLPLLAQATELFHLGQQHQQKGAVAEALETYDIEQELMAAGRMLPTLDADLEGLDRRTNERRIALEELAEEGLVVKVNKHKAELESLESNIVQARNAVELHKWQLKETVGGYTGCFFMVLACGIAAYVGNRLGGKLTIMLSLIAGVIISFPVYHLVNGFAPSRAQGRIQKQIEQNLREIELSEEENRVSNEALKQAQEQLARFRAWRNWMTTEITSSSTGSGP